MRWAVGLLLLIGSAAAQEPDGAIAPAHRWTAPRGCASGSFRSLARPVVTDVEEAWSIDEGPILAPPVHWDGIGYLVVGGKEIRLLAFDLASGNVRAKKKLKAFVRGAGLFVWDGQAIVQTGPEQINGYRVSGKSLRLTWIFRGPSVDEKPRLPVVQDNEVYCYLGETSTLARVRPGARQTSWTTIVPLENPSRPVIHGDYVFIAGESKPVFESTERTQIGTVGIAVIRRKNGRYVGGFEIGQVLAAGHSEFDLTFADNTVFVRSGWKFTGADRRYYSYAFVPIKIDATGVSKTGRLELASYDLPPAHTKRGMVVRSKSGPDRQWRRAKADKYWKITNERDQPDLFKDNVPPTVLGEILYFGSWAMDIETQEILWRLPVKRVDYAVVPADNLFLVVENGLVLRAFRGSARR